ncbi:MAG: helix-turn-helix domain-containing protein [Desulfovibrio sp.]|jgi:DNA-binding Xre family transcriptional regulator|nr:helix-turn-helix domain-containing protein [Desulfovibrio sp.]
MGKNTNPHIGSDFDDFLKEEGVYEEVNAGATKKLLALQLSQALAENRMTKTELAARMRTSRAAVNRLLDPENLALNLRTMSQAACALGKRMEIRLV